VRHLAAGIDGRNLAHDFVLTNQQARRFYDKYYGRRSSMPWSEFLVSFKLEVEFMYAEVIGDDVATRMQESFDDDKNGLIDVKELNKVFELWTAQGHVPIRTESPNPILQPKPSPTFQFPPSREIAPEVPRVLTDPRARLFYSKYFNDSSVMDWEVFWLFLSHELTEANIDSTKDLEKAYRQKCGAVDAKVTLERLNNLFVSLSEELQLKLQS
jgi:hypothetical protein